MNFFSLPPVKTKVLECIKPTTIFTILLPEVVQGTLKSQTLTKRRSGVLIRKTKRHEKEKHRKCFLRGVLVGNTTYK